MKKLIKRVNTPDELNSGWDNLAEFYFQKQEFLAHLHFHNPCNQRYYELYRNEHLVAGAIVYTLTVNALTFSNIPSPLNVQVIGLPVSVATPPIIGETDEYEYLLSELIKIESGLILGLNFLQDYLLGKALNMNTLPTVIFPVRYDNLEVYNLSLRHQYRRRIRKAREKFSGVRAETSSCVAFTQKHYELYLAIIKKSTTKLEKLTYESFRQLPGKFQLTTYYSGDEMLCWHIICKDEKVLFFYFGGMNYELRDKYHSYYNNLLGILQTAFEYKFPIVDFGQTAETAKTRLGGELSLRRMFVYHRNPVILFLFRLLSRFITYKSKTVKCRVFK